MSPTRSTHPPRVGSPSYQARNPGAVLLSKEADQQIALNTLKIVQALLDSTFEGNATSARLLISLAEGVDWTANINDTRRVLTLAGDWVHEPEWDGPVCPDSPIEPTPAEDTPPPGE